MQADPGNTALILGFDPLSVNGVEYADLRESRLNLFHPEIFEYQNEKTTEAMHKLRTAVHKADTMRAALTATFPPAGLSSVTDAN